ncbi:MAG TPA: amino acid adenylation domain-containing protein, partial [Ktedonobacteraceae bacterium]|nr:amino acid adenylation domain-containing protein [Ktedonobacteraceae bacterium]
MIDTAMHETFIENFRLSPQQRHLCTLQRTEEAFPYRTHTTVLLEGSLDLAHMYSALRSVVERYEILRTSFPCPEGFTLPTQVIGSDVSLFWEVYDCSSLPSQEQERLLVRMRETLTETYGWPCNLAEGPTWKAVLIRCSAERHWLWWDTVALNADIQSCSVLLKELGLYYAERELEVEQVEPLQYADLAEWLYEVLASGETSAGGAYWRAFERAQATDVALPYEHRGGSSGPFSPHALTLEIPSDLSNQLQDQACQLGVSEDILLLTCWGAVLARLTDQTNLLIGTGYDGRKYQEIEKAVGLFAKSLPLLYQFPEKASYSELVHQVKERVQQGYKWQEYFSWQLIEAQKEGEELFCPFDFTYDTIPVSWQAGGIRWTIREQGMYRDRFKVCLTCLRSAEKLQVTLHYDQNIFTWQDMQRLLAQWQIVCEQMLVNPEGTLDTLQLLTEQEKYLILSEWNATQADYSLERGIHRLFEVQVRCQPNAPALRSGEYLLSYKQLDQQANQLAHLLHVSGLQPGGRVALCLPRDHWSIIGLLAVLKAAGTYVPLDMELPAARLHTLLSELSPALIVSSQALQDRLPLISAPVLLVETLPPLLSELPDTAPEIEALPEAPAYIMFTSGSTGTPKGVLISHRSVSNYTQALCALLEVQSGWHFATVSSLAADLGNTAIFSSLASGGCLHVLPYELVTDAAALAAYVGRFPLDVLKIVPSHLRALLTAAGASILPRLRLVLGGEALPWSLLEQLRDLQPACQIYNHYGPTEATIGALVAPLGRAWNMHLPEIEQRNSSVPIGRPISNLQAYLLDTHRQLVPVGSVGELYIGGAGLSLGYLSAADLTAERFVPDPFNREGGARLYRTGDMARAQADGTIEFLGRQDTQVKLRGYRIELAEIEEQLRRHPDVKEAVAEAREEQLVAYIVPQQQPGPGREQLRYTLLESLPDYMVPTRFVVLEALPLTSNGKVDRRKLPAPVQYEAHRQEGDENSLSPMEELILQCWKQVLQVELLGVQDNFFEAGG